MNYTTTEQSKKLIELGLDPSTADLCFIGSGATIDPNDDQYRLDIISYNEVLRKLELMHQSDLNDKSQFGLDDGRIKFVEDKLRRLVPCWSLSALLHQLPFPVLWQEMLGGMIIWRCSITFMEEDITYSSIESADEIEAVIDCINWMSKHNYIERSSNHE